MFYLLINSLSRFSNLSVFEADAATLTVVIANPNMFQRVGHYYATSCMPHQYLTSIVIVIQFHDTAYPLIGLYSECDSYIRFLIW